MRGASLVRRMRMMCFLWSTVPMGVPLVSAWTTTTTTATTHAILTTRLSHYSMGRESRVGRSATSSKDLKDRRDLTQRGRKRRQMDQAEATRLIQSNQQPQTKDTPKNTSAPVFTVERLQRAAAKAVADRHRTTTSPPNTNNRPTATPTLEQRNTKNDVKSWEQLTRIMDEQLYPTTPSRGSSQNTSPHRNATTMRPGDHLGKAGLPDIRLPSSLDSMSSLLGYNHIKGDWSQHNHYLDGNKDTRNGDHNGVDLEETTIHRYNVAVVFGKRLKHDLVTIEYAARIRTLVQLMAQNPDFRPSLISFCGGKSPGNVVSSATAGYIYFRHLLAAQSIDLDESSTLYYCDDTSTTERDAMDHITQHVYNHCLPQWQTATHTALHKRNQYKQQQPDKYNHDSRTTFTKPPKLSVHFTLVSTEYHLCNLNDIHHRSPLQSRLNPIQDMDQTTLYSTSSTPLDDTSYYSPYRDPTTRRSSSTRASTANDLDEEDEYLSDEYYDDSDLLMEEVERGIVDTSWSFQYSTYPFIYAKEEAVAFLGKCFLLGEELMPLLVNMRGVVEQKEFFQRDNFLLLASIRRSLVSHVECLYNPTRALRKGLSSYQATTRSTTSSSTTTTTTSRIQNRNNEIDVVLEGALLSLGRCVDLVRPAGLLVSSVSMKNWIRALQALEHSMSEIRRVCDPDRPLPAKEWGKLHDDDDPILHIPPPPNNYDPQIMTIYRNNNNNNTINSTRASSVRRQDTIDDVYNDNDPLLLQDEFEIFLEE